jgi:hypothetical protein
MENKAFSVVAMCVCNKDCLPVGIDRCDTAPTPAGFAEVVCDDFPVFHATMMRVFQLAT